MSVFEKIKAIDWWLVLAICILAMVGTLTLYSVAGGSFYPWAVQHISRFLFAFVIMIIVAVIDIRLLYRYSWLFFAGSLFLLVIVELIGVVGMGAQRWIDLKVFKLQPSEIMKIALILVLARFYSGLSKHHISSLPAVGVLILILVIPSYLVFRQPDLGTAILMVVGGLCVAFLAGLSWKWIVGGIVLLGSSIPFVWSVVLRPYQQKRILTFLNPEDDPLGKGYHILQSKIAIGSGGFTGRGFMQGTQSNLGFLPEKHTDFIFAVVAEEFGFIGSVSLLCLVAFILFRIFVISQQISSVFGRLVAMGMGTTFFLYVLINVGMVMGLFPVVGVPFPLLSYGGTVMITIMVAFGFIQNMWVNKDMETPNI